MTAAEPSAPPATVEQGPGPGMPARFARQPVAMAGLIIVAVFGVAGLLAPWVSPYGMDQLSTDYRAGPSLDHLLGTDNIGRDTFSELLFGIRTSLYASVTATVIAVTVGSLLGLVAGYFRGLPDQLLMRLVDAVLSLPGLLMAMVVVGVLGRSVGNAMLGIAIAFVPVFARLVRGQVLTVREDLFVEAARVVGCGPTRIIRRHIVPNILPPLIVQAFMTLGFALLAEGALAFLGLSTSIGESSLGSMLQGGFGSINATPRLVLVPGLAITVLILAFNSIADGLRDALGVRR